ncbi:MAG: hypothetical protein ACLPID_19335 [Beijerinckiaceae bacterium]
MPQPDPAQKPRLCPSDCANAAQRLDDDNFGLNQSKVMIGTPDLSGVSTLTCFDATSVQRNLAAKP